MTFASRFCKIGHCIHILWCIFIGLGHNDPWVESHIRPNRCGVKGHLGSMTFGSSFCKNYHCIHILWCMFRRDSWFQNHLFTKKWFLLFSQKVNTFSEIWYQKQIWLISTSKSYTFMCITVIVYSCCAIFQNFWVDTSRNRVCLKVTPKQDLIFWTKVLFNP